MIYYKQIEQLKNIQYLIKRFSRSTIYPPILVSQLLRIVYNIKGNKEVLVYPNSFPCLVCEKAVRTNHNTVCCDMFDSWLYIYCKNICKITYRDLKKYQTPWFCKSCLRKGIPYFSLNDTELAYLSQGMSALPKRKKSYQRQFLKI